MRNKETGKGRTAYEFGSAWERQVIAEYTKAGFFCMRSAGSHTAVDVLAMKLESHEVHLIQCKASEVEAIPDLLALLKKKEMKKDPQEYFVVDTKKIPLPRTKSLQDSNVAILEGMYFSIITVKRILWKGVGRKNWFALTYSETTKQWECAKITQII